MYRKRTIESQLLRLSAQFPITTITGPRQSGKSTLCKHCFPDKPYVSLERLEFRDFAKRDPVGFLAQYPNGAILDEIQTSPELLSYLQVITDEKPVNGQFILSGSQQFELMQNVSQSLAGRTALIKLLPFSCGEIYSNQELKDNTISEIIYKGFYPRIFDQDLNPTETMSFYVSTYIERDLRALIQLKDLSSFIKFIKLCAGRTGQIINVASLANDAAISHNTAQHWLSLLETSYIIHFLRPHGRNFNRRLIKSPKLYFWDTGLVSYLLDIENAKQLENHPLKGALFETFVTSELIKQRFNAVKTSNYYYWRDNIGNEVDLIMDLGHKQVPMEIKLGQTLSSDYYKTLRFYQELNQDTAIAVLFYGGDIFAIENNIQIIGYQHIAKFNEIIV